MTLMTPREIVHELDKHIIGQDSAKRSVAIALRNRWRRMQLTNPLRDEVTPKNILMIGPTGVGKTEIARRLAEMSNIGRLFLGRCKRRHKAVLVAVYMSDGKNIGICIKIGRHEAAGFTLFALYNFMISFCCCCLSSLYLSLIRFICGVNALMAAIDFIENWLSGKKTNLIKIVKIIIE